MSLLRHGWHSSGVRRAPGKSWEERGRSIYQEPRLAPTPPASPVAGNLDRLHTFPAAAWPPAQTPWSGSVPFDLLAPAPAPAPTVDPEPSDPWFTAPAFVRSVRPTAGSQIPLIRKLTRVSEPVQTEFEPAEFFRLPVGGSLSAGASRSSNVSKTSSLGPGQRYTRRSARSQSRGTFVPTTPSPNVQERNSYPQQLGEGHMTDEWPEWAQWATFLAERDLAHAAPPQPRQKAKTLAEVAARRDAAARLNSMQTKSALFREWQDSLQPKSGTWIGLARTLRPSKEREDNLGFRDPPQCSENTPNGALCSISNARDILNKYTYIPAWVEIARRDTIFFKAILDFYFSHKIWPPFEHLPEDFRLACVREGIGPTLVRRQPGFAPVWVFELKKMDDRYFMNVVNFFFENKVFPPWNTLPSQFTNKFYDLHLNENKFYVS